MSDDAAHNLRMDVGEGAMQLQDAIDGQVIEGMKDLADSAFKLTLLLEDRDVEHSMIVSFLVGSVLKGTRA